MDPHECNNNRSFIKETIVRMLLILLSGDVSSTSLYIKTFFLFNMKIF